MSTRIDGLACRVRHDSLFLASALWDYARSEVLDQQRLAARLDCTPETLGRLALCRRPRGDSLIEDIERIAYRFQIHADVLLEIVRRADALGALRRAGETDQVRAAARDHEPDDLSIEGGDASS